MNGDVLRHIVSWTDTHIVHPYSHLGLRPSGRDSYRCSCGATATSENSLHHDTNCVWLSRDGDPDVAYFTRPTTSAALMRGPGTTKARQLGARLADFNRELLGPQSRTSAREIELLILDTVEMPSLPLDVMSALCTGYTTKWLMGDLLTK